MKKNILSDKLDELYRKENIYTNPIQTRPKPRAGITGEKPDEELKKQLANSWVFDKVMLYARCKELDWTTEVAYPEELQEMKEMWLETKGM